MLFNLVTFLVMFSTRDHILAEKVPTASGLIRSDYSQLNLTSVPQKIPISTTHLILSNNRITKIQNGNFKWLSKLIYLDISNNFLNKLDTTSFNGLYRLQILNISSNNLSNKASFAKGVFKPLSASLLELDMRDNALSLDYPDEAIGDLTSVRILKLDCMNGMRPGNGFSRLTNLTELTLANGKVHCIIIPENMFQNLQDCPLRYVDMSALGLTRIRGKFKLQHLETLKLSDNPSCAYQCTHIFENQQLPMLEHLYIQNTSLDSHMFFRVVQHVAGTPLKTLIGDQNAVTEVYPGIHEALPGLETFSMTGNQLQSTTELTALLTLKHLRYLNLSTQNQRSTVSYPRNGGVTLRQRYRRHSFADHYHICFQKPYFTCPIQFPANLTHLDISDSAFQLPTIPELALMNNTNSLQFVYLSANAIRLLPKPFYCPEGSKIAFRTIDLSHNEIRCVNSSYFTYCNWSTLNVFNLRQNLLKQTYGSDCDTNGTYFLSFIKPLWNLTKLDLSGNELDMDLQFNSFDNQKNLQELYLSDMGMSNFTIRMSHMTKLRKLDISSNNLKCLNGKAMMELSKLASHLQSNFVKTMLHVNLEKNPLQCTCQCYSFLKWLQSTDVIFTGKDSLSCTIGEDTYKLSDMNEIFIILDSVCYPRIWFHTIVEVEVTLLFLITMFTVFRRHKYRLYFLYLKLRILMVSKIASEEARPFHAFISYAEEDRQWVKKKLIKNLEERRKLKLLVASRDFEAGRLITDNIHSAITTSTKTVFVLSKSFLKSSWCLEEFSMALSECRKRKKFIMICIMSPKLTLDDIQYPELREVLQNITYLRWPPKLSESLSPRSVTVKKFKRFWQKLHTDIVTNDSKRYPNISVISPNGNVPV